LMDRIVLVGEQLRRAIGAWTHPLVTCASPATYRLERRTVCAVVVLGDDALRILPPRATLDRARRAGAEVWVVAVAALPEVLAPWLNSGNGRFVAASEFLNELAAVIRRLGRPVVPIEGLVDGRVADLCPDARRMLQVLRRLRRPRVKSWAAQLGIDRHTLTRRSRRHFGAPSDDVLWRWIVVAVALMGRDGKTVEQCAFAVGYSDASSLHRAFRTRGLDVPPGRATV
jgi:AraC-like DNA-binding protein